MNYRQLRNIIRNMENGEKISINAINLSERSIEVLRNAIEVGCLEPDPVELRKAVAPDAVYLFENGEYIAPQMTYIRFKL